MTPYTLLYHFTAALISIIWTFAPKTNKFLSKFREGNTLLSCVENRN